MTNHWDFSTKQTGSTWQCYQESTFSFVCNRILNFNLICCTSGAGTKCWKLRCFQFNIFIWVIYVDACGVHVCACVQPNLLPCLYDWIRSDVEEEGQSLGDKLPFFSAPPSPSSPFLSAVMRFTVELQSARTQQCWLWWTGPVNIACVMLSQENCHCGWGARASLKPHLLTTSISLPSKAGCVI